MGDAGESQQVVQGDDVGAIFIWGGGGKGGSETCYQKRRGERREEEGGVEFCLITKSKSFIQYCAL